MLELVDLARRYDDGSGVGPIDLAVAAGTTTVLIGPSGCGKSTLIRLVNGLAIPDQGSVRVNGRTLTPDWLLEARQDMGYVIQEGGLFPHLTARENVGLMASELGWARPRIDARIAELAMLAHLAPGLLSRYPIQLSGGQRQRLALMRALMLDPELLLLDEPLGALDPLIRYRLQEELKGIFSGLEKTVLMVTHDLAEAAHFGHWIVLLRDGHIEQQGRLEDLVQAPATTFVTEFLRAQQLSLAEGQGDRA
jgi:osmoprotectant transport system ATP-binding protein